MNNTDIESDSNQSNFLGAAEQMQRQLGPALCLAKWKQVSLHLTTGLTNSCYHPPLHQIPAEELVNNPSGLHNTPHKKTQRKIMLRRERPTECQYCWNMEDLGQLSDRHYRSGEPWAAEDYNRIVNSTGNEDDIIPSYVEVNFNHACNLACSYCSPQFSSTWQAEVDKWGGYPTSTVHNDPSHFVGRNRPIPVREHNPYVEAFWRWWPELYPQLVHFRMTGGEPLMDKNTYRVFDYVLANKNPNLHLNVTSNFSVEIELFNRYIDYIKRIVDSGIEHFMQYVSLDSGIPTQAEYLRHGLNFERLEKYVDAYLSQVTHHNSLTFIITMNNLSVTGFRPLMEWILELRKKYSSSYQRIWFDTPVLRQPAWQSLQILPESYAYRLQQCADWMDTKITTDMYGFRDYEVQRLRRDIEWMRQGQRQDHSKTQADFYRFFSEHDRRRGTNFLQSFPEMQEWWKQCQYHAR